MTQTRRLNRTMQWLLTLFLSVAVLSLPVAAQTMSSVVPLSGGDCMLMPDMELAKGLMDITCQPDDTHHTDCADCDTGSCQCPQLTLAQTSDVPGTPQWLPGFIWPVSGALPHPLISALERPPRF